MNFEYVLFLFCFLFGKFLESVDEIFGEIRNCLTPSFPRTGEFFEFPKMSRYRYKNESTKKNFWYFWLQKYINMVARKTKIDILIPIYNQPIDMVT